jgi:NADPH-dependent curcumin reductase CurA
MSSQANRQVRLNRGRSAFLNQITSAPLPDLADRQFLVRNEYFSVEPAMRGWVSAVANYSTPVGIGEHSWRAQS